MGGWGGVDVHVPACDRKGGVNRDERERVRRLLRGDGMSYGCRGVTVVALTGFGCRAIQPISIRVRR